MASCKGPILAALIYILSTAPAKRFRFALPKKGNESWAGLMLFCFFAVRSWRRCRRSVLHCCATGGRKGWRRFTLTSDNSNMNEQINKQTKTKSKLPQCCLFANRLEKPCYSKIPTSDFGPETTSQVNSPRSLLVNSRLVTLFQGQSRLSKFYCNRASPVGSQISGIAATSILFLFVCLFVLYKQITNITNGNSIRISMQIERSGTWKVRHLNQRRSKVDPKANSRLG